jgi:hypothetical protein
VSASAKLFPNATERPWLDGDLRHVVTATGSFMAREDDLRLAFHAVNTYDARDEALRHAALAFASIERRTTCTFGDCIHCTAGSNRMAIEAELVVKP